MQYGIWVVYENWASNGQWKLRDINKLRPRQSVAVGPLLRTEFVIFATQETGGGNFSHESTKYVDSTIVKSRKHY